MIRRSLPQKWLFFAPGAGFVLVLSGCAWMPPGGEHAEFMEPPPMERTLSKASRQGAATAVNAWPDDQWWRQFGSADLDRIMDKALRDNPGLKKAYDRLIEAGAVADVEGARLLPWLDADAEGKQTRFAKHGVVAAYNPALGGVEVTVASINPLSFRYEFDFWGKNRAALEAALGEAAAAQAEYAEARLLLTTAIARSYIRGVALAQQLALAQEMVALRHELLRLAETRFRTGLDTDDAAKQAAVELEIANKRAAGTRDFLVVQQDLLARLMGEGPDATQNLFGGKTVIIPARIPLPGHLPIELLAHRPDLASAMHRAEAAAERIHMAKAEFLPSVDLTAVGGLEAVAHTKNMDTLLGLLFRGSALNYAITPGVNLPLFEGGRLRGQLAATRAEYDEAVELYNETLLDAVRQVADSLDNWKETRTILEAQSRLLNSARGDLNLTHVRLRSGLNDRREVLTSRDAVLDQQYALKGLEVDHLFAMVDLTQALGGGYANGVDLPRPRLAPEQSLSGLETLTPAWSLETLAPTLLPPSPNGGAE
ncbi:MAG: histidine kinase [Beijerinckiaceae bacterium]|nr:MAG: histidine kinase [Beijerinckiaceae bacterium]